MLPSHIYVKSQVVAAAPNLLYVFGMNIFTELLQDNESKSVVVIFIVKGVIHSHSLEVLFHCKVTSFNTQHLLHIIVLFIGRDVFKFS